MSLAYRVLFGSLLLLLILVVLVVALADRRLERRLVTDTIATLAREAQTIASDWRPGVDSDSLAGAMGRTLQRRVTLIDSAGVVLGDSEFDSPALEHLQNHRTRPEVEGALRSGSGWSRRASPSAGDEELYVAVRVPRGVVRVSMTTRVLAEIVGGAQRDVLVAALVAVVVAVLLTVLFARGVSKPIVALRDVARRIAAGDLSQRPELSAAGEVGDLADALARMAEQLEARLGALEIEDALLTSLIESLNEGVLAVDAGGRIVRLNASARTLLGLPDSPPPSVAQLPRERALREALDDALAGNAVDPTTAIVRGRALAITARPLHGGGAVLALFDLTPARRLEAVRRDFVANVSHELRTPLTAINGFAETLADDESLDLEHRRFAQTIRTNAERMQHIVDDLLDLTRIESGGWTPAPECVAVAPIARDALSTQVAAAANKGVALQIDVESAPAVYADPTALRQVLANLVSNAIRHTSAGTIAVFSRAVAGGVAIGVRDSGSGIPPEHLPRIFERFYRVDPGRSRAEGGTGLGLAIVKHLVEAHGGAVGAESEPGKGTTVTAFFPAQPVESTP